MGTKVIAVGCVGAVLVGILGGGAVPVEILETSAVAS